MQLSWLAEGNLLGMWTLDQADWQLLAGLSGPKIMKSKSTKECQAIQEAIKTSNIWIINSSAWAILEKKTTTTFWDRLQCEHSCGWSVEDALPVS